MIFFFFNDTATTEIYTLSLHDALPIYARHRVKLFSVSSSWIGRAFVREGGDGKLGDSRCSLPRAGLRQGQRMPDLIRTAGIAYLFDQQKRSALAMAVLAALPILAVPAQAQSGDRLMDGVSFVAAIRRLDAPQLAGLTRSFCALIFSGVTVILPVRY